MSRISATSASWMKRCVMAGSLLAGSRFLTKRLTAIMHHADNVWRTPRQGVVYVGVAGVRAAPVESGPDRCARVGHHDSPGGPLPAASDAGPGVNTKGGSSCQTCRHRLPRG